MAKYIHRSKSGRILFNGLDGIRGIAALLIALRHTPLYFADIAFEKSYLAVDIFFLLSGVVLCNAYDHKLASGMSPYRFLMIRLIRIYPLYLLATAIAIIPFLYVSKSVYASVFHVVLSVFMIPNPADSGLYFPLNGPTWSLLFEIVINAFYALMIRFLTLTRIALLLAVAAIGLCVCVYLWPDRHFDFGWTIQTVWAALFRVTFSFFLGVFICRIYLRKPIQIDGLWGNILSILAVLTIAWLLMTTASYASSLAYDIICVGLVFPAVIAFALHFQPSGRISRLLHFLGAISYALYVLHEPAGKLLHGVVLKLFHIEVAQFAPWSGALLLVCLTVLCWLLDRFYDAPVRQRMTAITGRRHVLLKDGTI